MGIISNSAHETLECYVGGKRRNMPLAKRKELDGRGPVGKVAVAENKGPPNEARSC